MCYHCATVAPYKISIRIRTYSNNLNKYLYISFIFIFWNYIILDSQITNIVDKWIVKYFTLYSKLCTAAVIGTLYDL